METKYVKVVFDRKNKVSKKGTGSIELIIFGTRECRKYVTLGECRPDEFDGFLKNPIIQENILRYENIAHGMVLMGEKITLENLDRHLGIVPENPTTDDFKSMRTLDLFNDYFMKEAEFASSTCKKKSKTLKLIEQFGKFKTLGDITPENLKSFDEWMHDGTRQDVAVYCYHKNFKKWCRLAYEDGYLPENPYNKTHFSKGQSKERNPLLQHELDKLIKMKLIGRYDKARDLFIFAAHTGMAYCDVRSFKFETMTEEINGMFYIDGSRTKTKTNFFTPILEPAMNILKKYGYHLPMMSNQKINDYLFDIASAAKINKPVTFHIARHTFATLALANEVPIADVAKMLGHKSINTTQIYAKVLKENIAKHAERWTNTLKTTSVEKNAKAVEVTRVIRTKTPRFNSQSNVNVESEENNQVISQPVPQQNSQPATESYYPGSYTSFSYTYV